MSITPPLVSGHWHKLTIVWICHLCFSPAYIFIHWQDSPDLDLPHAKLSQLSLLLLVYVRWSKYFSHLHGALQDLFHDVHITFVLGTVLQEAGGGLDSKVKVIVSCSVPSVRAGNLVWGEKPCYLPICTFSTFCLKQPYRKLSKKNPKFLVPVILDYLDFLALAF